MSNEMASSPFTVSYSPIMPGSCDPESLREYLEHGTKLPQNMICPSSLEEESSEIRRKYLFSSLCLRFDGNQNEQGPIGARTDIGLLIVVPGMLENLTHQK